MYVLALKLARIWHFLWTLLGFYLENKCVITNYVKYIYL